MYFPTHRDKENNTMKTPFICAFILPVLSACVVPAGEPESASYKQETVYTTGSNLPSKQAKSANMKTLTPEQAADMVPIPVQRGPKG